MIFFALNTVSVFADLPVENIDIPTTPQSINSQEKKEIEAEIEKINQAIQAGVKVGSKIKLNYKVFDNKKVSAAIKKWEQACKQSKKPENAKTLYVSLNNGQEICMIDTCVKGYTASYSKNRTTCEKEPEPTQQKTTSTTESTKSQSSNDSKKSMEDRLKDNQAELISDVNKETQSEQQTKQKSSKGQRTKEKDSKTATGTACKTTFGTGKYDANKKCIVDKCNDDKNYVLNTETNTCELKTTADIRNKNETNKQNRQNTKEEKAFLSDAEKLSKAFEAIIEKLKQDCEKDNGKIQDGECVKGTD